MNSILQACCSTRSSRNWLSAGIACALLAACSTAPREHQLDFFALGTEVSVSVYGVGNKEVERASQSLQAYFAVVGHDWYPWRPGELQRVNTALAAQRPVQVSPPLAHIIRRAAELEIQSNNTFNAGLGGLTELWGLDDITVMPEHVPDAAAIDELLSSGLSLTGIEWRGDEIRSAPSTLMIDLGGIAKGAILEESIRLLLAAGIDNAIVNIGGDLTVLGSIDGRAARIGIRSPTAAAAIAAINIAAGETILTSGNYERFVEIGGHRYTHILDPRSGYPVEHTASVTVVHTDAALADAAATALMVGGSVEFDALTQALGLEFALLIDASGDLRLTPAMGERLDWLD
ncbi:MAG: FAD:protein FMN transferase [Proteobacteria bacterium]|nr:FAD:protein FMN transferase [Pseudomonadota bacterium]